MNLPSGANWHRALDLHTQRGYDARGSLTLRRFDAHLSFVLTYRFTVSTDGDRQFDVPCCPFRHSFVAYRASDTHSVVTDVTAPTGLHDDTT